jgi:hypothetical protein
MTQAEIKKFEDQLAATTQHTNKQTFSADSSVLIAETIDTPGVSTASKTACLIHVATIAPDWGTAENVLCTGFRTQICGGTHVAMVTPDDPKFVAECRLRCAESATGVESRTKYPFAFGNVTKAMLIVNPKMTIMHVADNQPDLASEDIFLHFKFSVVELSLAVFLALRAEQMSQS